MNPGLLVMPALRWRALDGFAHEGPAIAAALEAGVGGFIVFGGESADVKALTDCIRRDAGRPLLFGADLERGAGQQFAGLAELPPPLALAALADPAVIRDAGRITATDARSVGINWVFAPVADLDLEAENPIVQTRSFGADPARVSAAVADWVTGARDGGVLCCAKHFPGHGRTRQDSHDQTPVVAATAAELAAVDALPFAAAVAAGVDSLMTCHVAFPALDPSNAPATLSAPILARARAMGFTGLIVSDALVMEGFAGTAGAAAGALGAVIAGVDVLLYPPDAPAVTAALAARVHQDPAFAARVAESLERYRTALARVADVAPPSPGDRLAETAAIADRLVRDGAPTVRLRAPLDLVVADDDQDGAFPPSPNDWLHGALRSAGVPLGPGGSRVLLAFAEPRASKGRAGFGPRCRAIFGAAASGLDLAVLFGHPRLAAELPASVPLQVGWHRQRLMQEAVARWLRGCLA